MNKIIYYAAVLANLVFICLVFFLMTEARGHESYLAALLFLPPVLSLVALYCGPDVEERKLAKAVRKAELRLQLAKLENGK